MSLPAMPLVVMTGEWSDEFNPEGLAARADCGMPSGNHYGAAH
jgi:hypothetical protein